MLSDDECLVVEEVKRAQAKKTNPQVMDEGIDNEITVFVFRLLVLDLLSLFHVLNQALINLLRTCAQPYLLLPFLHIYQPGH